MIGKYKFRIIAQDDSNVTIWATTQEEAANEWQKKFTGQTFKEILPNKEFLKKYKVKKVKEVTNVEQPAS